MIPREARWLAMLALWSLLQTASSQNERSYDTSDWIPITHSSAVEPPKEKSAEEPSPKKATARVLNIESPNQKFFPENEYEYRKGRPQETPYLKGFLKSGPRPHKPVRLAADYKYELPAPPPVSQKQHHPMKYLPQQIIAPPPPEPQQNRFVEQRPFAVLEQQYYNKRLLPPMPNVNPQVPDPNAPSLYEQYNIPFNQSFYQSLNPSSINQELLAAPQKATDAQANQQPSTIRQEENQKENIQLLYVPLENLKPNQPAAQDTQAIYKQISAPPLQENQYYPPQDKQHLLDNIQEDYAAQALQSYKLQEQIQLGQPLLFQSTSTTPKPKKRKPHQPPLSIFMRADQRADISDVLDILSEAKSIAVQDTVEAESPKIFIGPSNLNPSNGFAKFPLPYLNSLDGDRIERKIDNMPFFVAPLSYKTPAGYSKIRLPSPHVGSVVISNKEELHEKSLTQKPIHYEQANEFSQFKYTPVPPSQPSYYTHSSQDTAPVLGNPGNSVTADLINRSNEIIRNAERIQAGRNKVYSSLPTSEAPELIAYRPQQDVEFKPNVQEFYPSRTASTKQNYHVGQETNSPYQQNIYTFTQKDSEYLHQPQIQFSQQPYKLPVLDANHIPKERVPISTSAPKIVDQTNLKSNTIKPTQSYESLTSSKAENPDINPLELAINEFELHQINSELIEPNKKLVKHSNNFRYRPETERRVVSSTPLSVSNTQNEETRSTPRPERVQQRRRGRPSRPTTPAPTEPITSEKYTVFENFNFRQPTSTENYLPREQDVAFKQTSFDPQEKYKTRVTEIEEIPSSVYKLNVNEERVPQYENDAYKASTVSPSQYEGFQNTKQTQESYTIRPLQQSVTPTRQHSYNTQYLQPPDDNSQLYLDANFYSKSSTPTYDENRQENGQEYTRQQAPNEQQGLFETTGLKNTPPSLRPGAGFDVSSDEYTSPETTRQQANFKSVTEDFESRGHYQTESVSPSSEIYQQSDENYINLQDQAVRSLLVPRLLVPTTQQDQTTPKIEISPPTETTIQVHSARTEAPQLEKTTRTQRTRGRQRTSSTNNRQQASTSTTSSLPRRGAGRRRPVQRTTTEKAISKEYVSKEDTEIRTVAANKQRFRTKSRPLAEETHPIDRVSTTEQDIQLFKQPMLEGGFEAASIKPSSYMQYEHTVDELDIITLKPEQNEESAAREYHQLYSLSAQAPTTENPRFTIQYENTGSTLHQPVVDVQITHPIQKPIKQVESDIITKPSHEEQYVRYNTNIQSGGVLRNNKNVDERSRTTPRTRGRTRGRSRFATSEATTSGKNSVSSTTRRPTSSTTTTQRQLSKQEREEEFFGFIRAPNFGISQPAIKEQPQQETYPLRQVPSNIEPESETQSVRFVGEIRPKYRASTQKTITVVETEATRPRKRGRIRVPTRKNKEENNRGTTDNDVNSSTNTEHITRRSSELRSRGRGTAHFRVPDSIKKSSGDEDVEGGNYPVPFLEKRELITPKPSLFQITVEPTPGDDEVDQSPHPSLYSASILPTPENWTATSSAFSPNQITDDTSKVQKKEFVYQNADQINSNIEPNKQKEESMDDKILSEDDNFQNPSTSSFQNANDQVASTERLVGTTENSDEIFRQITETAENISNKLEKIVTSTQAPTEEPVTKILQQKNSRRKGVWKLIRHHPVDPFETAESQNYHSVLNSFDTIVKINPYERVKTMDASNKDQEHHLQNYYSENKNTESFSQPQANIETLNESQKLDEVTTEMFDFTSEKTGPTDKMEISDNNKDMTEKTTEPSNPSSSKTEELRSSENTFLDSIYEMFGVANEQETTTSTTEEPKITSSAPTFPEEMTEAPLVTETQFSTFPVTTTLPQPESIQSVNITVPTEITIKSYEVEPWEMKAVKTSTSTEVSHETEICYKGRCVKSKDFVKRL